MWYDLEIDKKVNIKFLIKRSKLIHMSERRVIWLCCAGFCDIGHILIFSYSSGRSSISSVNCVIMIAISEVDLNTMLLNFILSLVNLQVWHLKKAKSCEWNLILPELKVFADRKFVENKINEIIEWVNTLVRSDRRNKIYKLNKPSKFIYLNKLKLIKLM